MVGGRHGYTKRGKCCTWKLSLSSHSGMLNTGIYNNLAKPYNMTVFSASGGGDGTYPSALLLPGTTRIYKEQSIMDEGTKAAVAAVIAEMSKSETSVLLYSADYSYQISEAANSDNHESWNIRAEESGETLGVYKPLFDALDEMSQLIGNRKFILIGGVPSSSKYQTLRCIAQLKWFSIPSLCSKEQSRFDNKATLAINDALRSFLAGRKNVFYIDPYDVLCDENICRNTDNDGNPLYSDAKHLSKVGSDYFVERIRDQLLDIIGVKAVTR